MAALEPQQFDTRCDRAERSPASRAALSNIYLPLGRFIVTVKIVYYDLIFGLSTLQWITQVGY